jgi:hypothetical protein
MDRTKPKLLDLLAEELLVQILSELDGESMMNARAVSLVCIFQNHLADAGHLHRRTADSRMQCLRRSDYTVP